MNIDLIRGDTLNIQFELESDTVISLESDSFDVAFSVKQAATDGNYTFQKGKSAVTEIGENTFIMRIAPADTENLIPGWYYYDLQLAIGSDIYTIAIGKLQLIRDITLPPNSLPTFIYPDVNGDGTVDSQDALLILTAYMNIGAGLPSGLTEEQENIADCNRDGAIDSTDASLVSLFITECEQGKYVNNSNGWTEFMINHYNVG